MTNVEVSAFSQDRRSRRIAEVCEVVIQTMNLRAPQTGALRQVARALAALPKPLSECSPAELRGYLSEGGRWTHASHPVFTLSLATGVGKTRLAGALIALLYLTRESTTFLILAPRRAVLRRFSDALNPRFREYLFVDPALVPDPYVVSSDEVAGPAGVEAAPDAFRAGPTIYLLSPQLIATSGRFKGEQAFSGRSPAKHLAAKKDLVVLVDEAHHVGGQGKAEAAKWTEAIRGLEPALQFGLTATPRGEAGENLLFDYPLSKALIERLYTKDVHLLVRNFEKSLLAEEEIDRATIDYALMRLAEKKRAIAQVRSPKFPQVKPVAVFFARDIEHAEWVAKVLRDSHDLADEEILVTHSRSSKSEEEVEKLLSIEAPNNRVKVVVNVQELTEGWDVRNVYVVAPLRAMATFQGALQAMGRGLRLPAGERIGDPEVDTLDIVCFGKQALNKIVKEATSWLGRDGAKDGAGLVVDEYSEANLVQVSLHVPELREEEAISLFELEPVDAEVEVEIHPDALKYSARMAIEDLDLSRLKTRLAKETSLKIPRDAFVRAAVFRVIRSASRYLSDDQDFARVRAVIESWLAAAGAHDEMIEFDPAEIGEQIGRLISDAAKRRALDYQPTGRKMLVEFGPYEIQVVRSVGSDKAAPTASVHDLEIGAKKSFSPGEYYRGMDGRDWSQSLHAAYRFDSFPELRLAWLLDTADNIDWWCRNDPKRLSIMTPAGSFSPDFLLATRSGGFFLAEAKDDLYWDAPESEARTKAASACKWVELQSTLSKRSWEFGVALTGDILAVSSFEALLPRLRKS